MAVAARPGADGPAFDHAPFARVCLDDELFGPDDLLTEREAQARVADLRGAERAEALDLLCRRRSPSQQRFRARVDRVADRWAPAAVAAMTGVGVFHDWVRRGIGAWGLPNWQVLLSARDRLQRDIAAWNRVDVLEQPIRELEPVWRLADAASELLDAYPALASLPWVPDWILRTALDRRPGTTFRTDRARWLSVAGAGATRTVGVQPPGPTLPPVEVRWSDSREETRQRMIAASERLFYPIYLKETGINALFLQSDQRRYYLPCPACRVMQALTWEDNVDQERALVVCRDCRAPMDVLLGGGWRAEAADAGPAATLAPPTGVQDGGAMTTDTSWITNFIWGIADDVLRDLYVRGKYRDVILPMTVLRRLDAVLEPTSAAVLAMKATLDQAGLVNQEPALRQAAGQSFYNTSDFTMRDLRARTSQQQLRADFEAYLDGFSPNVQEILEKFKFRNQVPTLVEADALGFLLEKFLDPSINLSPHPVLDGDGTVRLEGLDNHGMGTAFEELIRRFNEENNEEAGEHFTPRDAVRLMARLVFLPVADEIQSGTYLLYDGACGTGGMLTVSEETLRELAAERGKQVSVHLYGQEVNPETYAISKADLILKGEGGEADNMQFGSTLANDAFPAHEFDFMLSNPPYGKSWKSDLERMGGKGAIRDPRFVIAHDGDPEYSLVTRSSDGQMLFLANMLSKMKHGAERGSRIAEVHNGSSLFTGDAGQGESNIRRWIIENDWLEAIVALPLNMFYNTGIATYVWVLSNRKAAQRRGRVQLIDATQWFQPLRKNLGKKNCELSPDDIRRICDVFLAFEETEQSKIFPNQAFGYWKLTVERPLRLAGIDPGRAYAAKEIKALRDEGGALRDGAARHQEDPPPGGRARPASRPVRDRDQRPARGGRVRARQRAARHRAGAAAGGGRHRGLPAPRGPALRAGCLVRPRQREGGLRGQLHALLLQAPADAQPGGDPGGYTGPGAGDRGIAGRDCGRRPSMIEKRPTSLDPLDDIALLDPLDVPAQLSELREMEDGWLDGEGVAPGHELLDWLSAQFDRCYPDDLPLPHVYPTVEGGVQAEWSISRREISLSVDPATREGTWHVLDMGTDSEEERTLDLTDDRAWTWVAEQIHSLSEAPQ